MLIFHIFGQLSGLKINFDKSELSITAASPLLTQSLAAIIQCKSSAFPIKYLGLPLSDTRLHKADYMPLIQKIQNKLAGWKATLLSVGGRIVLINAVLTAMAQFFMSAFMLSKWATRAIDKIRRSFLWHGAKDQQNQRKGLNMVNWALVIRPKKLGGLGIRDIHLSNQALLAKWLWQWEVSTNEWWKEANLMICQSDKPWNVSQQTHFWKAIRPIAPAFNSSVAYSIGNGKRVKFWQDNWNGTPFKLLFPHLYQEVQQKNASVHHHAHQHGWELQLPTLTTAAQAEKEDLLNLIQSLRTTPAQDAIKWLRQGNNFTVRSFYNFLSHSPTPTSTLSNIWSIKAPPRILVFAWLLLQNRLPTIDNLARRGWQLPNMCIMCKQNEESVPHLFRSCPQAIQVRAYLLATFSDQQSKPHKITSDLSTHILMDPKEANSARNWEITVSFIIWRERCRRIFSDKFLDLVGIVREIRAEYHNWFQQNANVITYDPG